MSVTNSLGFGFTGIASTRRIDGSASIGRELSTGATIGLGVSTSYLHSHRRPIRPTLIPAIDTSGYTDSVDVQLTQPLLRGRGRAVAYALQVENALLADAAALTRRQDAINIVENVVTGYWDLGRRSARAGIAEGSLDLAKERLRVTQIGVSGGKVADSELLAVEEAIQTRQEDVINAQVAIVQQSLFLRRTIGLEIGPNQIGLDAGAELSIPQRTWDLADLNQAEHSSPQLASLAKQEQNATMLVEVTENGLLPQLDFALAIGPDGSGATETEALKELAKASGLFVQGSLTFSQSIGRHQVYGQERQYRAQREKVRVNAQDPPADRAGARASGRVGARRRAAGRRRSKAGRARAEEHPRRAIALRARQVDELRRAAPPGRAAPGPAPRGARAGRLAQGAGGDRCAHRYAARRLRHRAALNRGS